MADERITPLLKRVFLFLEDGDFIKADEYCEKVLDIDPENAEAYLGKLMVETMAKKREILGQCNVPFVNSLNYQKILRFGDDALRAEVEGYIKEIVDRNEAARLESIYNYAYGIMNSANDEPAFKAAAEQFNSISSYKDAAKLAEFCTEKSKTVQFDNVYNYAYGVMNSATDENGFKAAAEYFRSINGYKDAAELAEFCTEKAEAIRLESIYNYAHSIMNCAADETAFIRAAEYFKSIANYKDSATLAEFCAEKAEITRLDSVYTKAYGIMKSAQNNENALKTAAGMFSSISDYKDSAELAEKCLQDAETARKDYILFMAKSNMVGNNIAAYENAVNILESIKGWKDADDLIVIANKTIEEIRIKEEEARIERERLAEEAAKAAKKRKKKIKIISILSAFLTCAAVAFVVVLMLVIIPNRNYNNAVALLNSQKYDEAVSAFKALDGYKDSEEKAKEAKYAKAVSLMNAKNYTEAINTFKALGDYKDSKDKINQCRDKISEVDYNEGVKFLNSGEKVKAAMAFGAAASYKDSRQKSFELWNDIAKRETIAAGAYHSVAIKANGTVVATTIIEDEDTDYSYDYGQCNLNGWTDIIAIAAGDCHTVGLKADGTVVAAGDNGSGQCDVSDWTDIVAIAADDYHTVGLKSDGTVITTDTDDVSGWTDIVAIAAGTWHTVGLKADGTVVAAGSNYNGECDVSDWTNIIAVSAGTRHTVGLKADGTVVATRYIEDEDTDYSSDYGQCDVSGWRGIVAVSAGDYHTVGLKSDGTAVAVGWSVADPEDAEDLSDIVAVDAGYDHTLGLKSDGTVVAFGWNTYGQCDVSTWQNIKLPE